MNKSMAAALLLSISSLHGGVQEPNPKYGYAKRLAGLIALTLLFKKVTPQRYCDLIAQAMIDNGHLLAVTVVYPFLIRDMNHDQSN